MREVNYKSFIKNPGWGNFHILPFGEATSAQKSTYFITLEELLVVYPNTWGHNHVKRKFQKSKSMM